MLRLTATLLASIFVVMVVYGEEPVTAQGGFSRDGDDLIVAEARPDRPARKINSTAKVPTPEPTVAAMATGLDTLGGRIMDDADAPQPLMAAAAATTPQATLIQRETPASIETEALPEVQTAGLGLSSLQEDPLQPVLAAVLEDAPEMWRVTGTRVNVRSGPSTGNPVINGVVADQEVEMIELLDNGWAQIRIDETSVGYMSARFLDKID